MDLKALSKEDFNDHFNAVLIERDRRRKLVDIPEAMNALNIAYLTAEGREQGAQWEQPMGAENTYPRGWQVTDEGKTWTSLVPNNVWKPGVANWRETPADGGVPEWVQPGGAGSQYNTGDHVMFEGQEYVSIIDNNNWSPTGYPAGWQLVEDTE